MIALLSVGAGLLAGLGAVGATGHAAPARATVRVVPTNTQTHRPQATASSTAAGAAHQSTYPSARQLAAATPTPVAQTAASVTAYSGVARQAQALAVLTASRVRQPRSVRTAPQIVDPASVALPPAGPLLLLNPDSVAQGATINILGTGFDASRLITLTIEFPHRRHSLFLDTAQAGRDGSFSKNVTLPTTLEGHAFWVVAREHKGTARAMARGTVAVGSPTATLSTAVGKPGDTVYASARGFAPHEAVDVFLNNLGTAPVVTLQADANGALSLAPVPVPYGAAGPTSLLLLGRQSRGLAAVPFEMLNLYPTGAISSYSAVADTVLRFSVAGFGPNENVDIRVNTPNGYMVGQMRADSAGNIRGGGRFRIPFSLKGRNTFVLTGEQSHTSTTIAFTVQPYTPLAAPSSYGGGPGTAITFYGTGFARHETVRVWLGHQGGQQVATMTTDGQGNLVARPGLYFIGTNVRPGKLIFVLAGDKSATAVPVSFDVQPAAGPVQLGATTSAGGQ